MKKNYKKLFLVASLAIASVSVQAQVQLKNYSNTPNLLKLNTAAFPKLQSFNLIGSDDVLPQSPNYIFGGSADGAGMIKNADGTFTYLVNQEDNFSVSRITLDATFKPVKGEYVVNSNGGMWRLCSATMAKPAIHGFGPMFFTCGESGAESMTHAINPMGSSILDSASSVPTLVSAFGRWSAENAMPIHKDAYPGKSVFIITDDDSGAEGGQVGMYVGNTGDYTNGNLYVLRRSDLNQKETNMKLHTPYDVEFVQIENQRTLTGAQINSLCANTLKAMKFGRVEDCDFRKGSPAASREVYFTVTGQPYTGVNADSSRTKWGRVYRLILDPSNPLKGKLTCVMDGDNKAASNPAAPFYDPDNIMVTEDFVYVEEDPNGYNTTAEAPYTHDARIYQYDMVEKTIKQVMELDHHRSAADSVKFNNDGSGNYKKSGKGDWEYGGFEDVSLETGIPNTFILSIQPHTWIAPKYKGVDGGTKRLTENQASLLAIITGLPRTKMLAPTSESKVVCKGGSATLLATNGSTFEATNGTVYRWYTDAAATTPVFVGKSYTTPAISKSTGYYVSSYLDGIESAKTPVNVLVDDINNTTPAVTLVGRTLTSNFTTGNQWYCNDSAIVGATAQTYNAIIGGRYTARVFSANGCISQPSIGYMIATSAVTENSLLANQLTIYPNPASQVLNVQLTNIQTSVLKVEVRSMTGQLVSQHNFGAVNGSVEQSINISQLVQGSYVVTIITDRATTQQIINKQ